MTGNRVTRGSESDLPVIRPEKASGMAAVHWPGKRFGFCVLVDVPGSLRQAKM